MRYYIIAGEPSGDLHGSNLMRAIKAKDPDAVFAYWGGDNMSAVADGIVTHIRETSIMGFVEVVKNIGKIGQFFVLAKKTIADFEPDRVILIDYPGFNLRMAKWAKNHNYDVTYYISPQLWAWKKGRIVTVKKYVDRMLCILPFEKVFYAEHGVMAHYVGHPLISVIDQAKKECRSIEIPNNKKKVLAILPGSRKQEISKVLPTYIAAATRFLDTHDIIIAGAPNIDVTYYHEVLSNHAVQIEVFVDRTYQLLYQADLAIVTSGTATLETALFGVPQVVCYRTSSINYMIGSRLVDLQYISLVNLILDEGLIPELIQNEMTADNIAAQLQSILNDRTDIKAGYDKLQRALKTEKDASAVAADAIIFCC